ncbi:hypothetical protein [Streptomyces sp. NPDC002889]|uniref:hypothetical protein n=1 Tax=Streptomyces sp. NPDC002889 TaxID=3364669 RepID=UPI0036A60FF8
MSTTDPQPGGEARGPIVVFPVTPENPPFRVVEVDGIVIGTAHDIVELIELASHAGRKHVDLDDPAQVRWVGGGKYKWRP